MRHSMGYGTQLPGMRNLPFPHAAPYPNDGTAKIFIPAHAAGSQFVREQMLAHYVLARAAAPE